MNNQQPVDLSIVATIYNDEATIQTLVEEFINQLRPMGITFEIILVNDHSRDGSLEQIRKVCLEKPFVKGVGLARNYGQQIAVSAGLKHAAGKYVLAIDGDLENPIEAIPDLYKKIQTGKDIVYTVSKKRQSLLKRLTSEMFWIVLCRFLRIEIVQHQLMLRIMSRRMVDAYNQYPEISRSVAGITHDIGFAWDTLEVTPNERKAGRSNYSFTKRLNIFLDIVLNLSLKPLNFVIFLGFFTFLFSLLASAYYLYIYFTIGTLAGYTSVILSIFFFGGVTIFTLGIMARYLSLIYLEVRQRPLFLVDKTFNL